MGLIFNEACTNAFKYAFPNGKKGHVNASFGSLAGRYHLTVSDNGRGYDPIDAKEGFGTTVMRRFAHQLSGELKVMTGIFGTSIALAFPRDVLMGKPEREPPRSARSSARMVATTAMPLTTYANEPEAPDLRTNAANVVGQRKPTTECLANEEA